MKLRTISDYYPRMLAPSVPLGGKIPKQLHLHKKAKKMKNLKGEDLFNTELTPPTRI